MIFNLTETNDVEIICDRDILIGANERVDLHLIAPNFLINWYARAPLNNYSEHSDDCCWPYILDCNLRDYSKIFVQFNNWPWIMIFNRTNQPEIISSGTVLMRSNAQKKKERDKAWLEREKKINDRYKEVNKL